MALSKGTNSYATVDEANAYFEDRLDAAAWSSADSTERAKALVTATGQLDLLSWAGMAISENQPLSFPRNLTYFEPRIGATLTISTVPTRIINATFELAYHLLNNDGLLDDSGSVRSIAVGSINLGLVQAPNKIPSFVNNLIQPLLLNNGSTAWWRAN